MSQDAKALRISMWICTVGAVLQFGFAALNLVVHQLAVGAFLGACACFQVFLARTYRKLARSRQAIDEYVARCAAKLEESNDG